MTEKSQGKKIAPPSWLKALNEDLMEQQRLDTGMADLPVLTVPGRRTGQPRRTPLTVLELDGQRYVLEGFPGADWAQNLRAAGGHATLSIGARHERVRLVELDAEAALPVLRAWPVEVSEGAGMMRDAGVVTAVTPEAFEAVAGTCGVFRVERE
ncbi:nitroreductase/quinone reductase family protein [Pseudonocardia nigra]|uniref:nitroreductase/quinone reductase family protein n=1 Tax=Pseudonocardia nigra TaxID=1921578 RepID=UPI001C5E8CD2|nr:nitroreductase/quinone reductase family protein [Pseudonocardia nigra]